MPRWMLPSAGLAALLLAASCGRPAPAADQPAPTPAELTAPPAPSAPPAPTGAPTSAPTSAAASGPLPSPTAPAARPAPPAAKFVALATRDLAARLGISADQIVAASAEPIIWPDAALGCPRPGQVYTQGRVPGFRIVLNAQSQQYRYHTDEVGQIVLCPPASTDAAAPAAGPSPQIGVPIR